jgi:uncharacterized protein
VNSGERFDDIEIPATWTRAVRVDAGRLAKAEKVPGGGVRVPATIAVAGVLTYYRADGVRRELLPPEEASRLESLRTLRDAPVTLGHPTTDDGKRRMVTPATFQKDSIGHVSGEPRSDGQRVMAELVIGEAAAVSRADSGELVELSAGYTVLIDPTPGEWNGHRYDAVQRRREYNHVALLPRGGARAGEQASLRLDGVDDFGIQREPQDPQPIQTPVLPAERNDSMTVKSERIDGVDYEVGSTTWQQARMRFDESQRRDSEAQTKRIAELESALKTEKAEREKLQGNFDGLEKKHKELEAKLAAESDPKRLDERVAARADLVSKARVVLGGEAKFDGKSDVDIMREVLAKTDPKEDLKGRTEEYLRGRFDTETKDVGGDHRRSSFDDSFTSPRGHGRSGNHHTIGRTPPPRLDTPHRR